ncbi:MAG: DNA starvation/stationary phase protection protein [Flavobacteriaceae bacterium]|nr:DNA starvation/stationary phase protection protein [Flavobacteriaceae bacterium]
MEAIKNKRQTIKSYKKLGFTHLETAEIVVNLKRLIANYQVHYHKLRNFHWNVDGPDFFELHDEFENEYNSAKEMIDILAERIRVFGIKPNFSMSRIMELSEIKEPKQELSALSMVGEVLKDYEILHDSLLDVLTVALDNGDTVTEQIITDSMRRLEMRNWMFTSWCK